MAATNLTLILFIIILLAYALYDQIVVPRRRGPALLSIPLLRRTRADGAIFIGLVILLICNNLAGGGPPTTTWLLSVLALTGLYLFWLRTPKIHFKAQGFLFAGAWTEYKQIKEMNLSADGVLVVQLERRRLLIRVKNISSLEKIYDFLVNNQ
ncbi:DUF986 family protein [Intestinirhabdus alba]|jgi:uncharacterized membrane protein YobD (UPF0266 family)|uniref:UPF0266 membrane protein GJV78_13105 n=1 Tax=Intestinirhabdus alba TaxID=2899544 RepID=A0A6L6IMR8_9ENTR|nr:DUF986 family protein [Intestinirhabdus alba]MTH47177.1 DUF986 family protein [Intestinirhabdus alba]